jgi:beta-glucosidase
MRRLLALCLLLAACGDSAAAPDASPGCPGTPVPQPPGLDPMIEARVDALLSQMTLDEKLAEMHGTSLTQVDALWPTGGVDRLGIPPFRMVDGNRGVAADPSTCYPVGQARGAAFDRDLEQAIGEAIGAEAAAHGANVILAPTINVLRHPAWGRAQETYGEDPYEVGELGAAFVTGAQQHVVATPKHFACNSIEDTRFDVSVDLDERALREVYLPHFEKAVRAGAGAFMTAYNQVNGVYASENPHLLRDILKGEWGYAGFVMSDWVFGTRSAAPAVHAGLDMEMPLDVQFTDLPGQVARCEVTLAEIDDAVRRILRTKLAFGLDDPPPPHPSQIESAAHAALALRAAEESIVLLENDGVLPLGAGTIAVVGAMSVIADLGDEGSSDVDPSHAVSPLDGLTAQFSSVLSIPADTLDDATRAQVAGAAAAVVVVGLTSADEGENIPGSGKGDRATLALSAAHQALIADVAAHNPHTIVVLEGGSTLLVEPWIDSVAAVLEAWYPGQEGGTAIAEILAGTVAPSGRLPVTFPVAEADLPPFDHTSDDVTYDLFHGYRYLDREGTDPAFPFGFGLSYGSATYDSIDLTEDAASIHVTVQVTGVGAAHDEIVELYVEPPAGAPVERIARELRGFARVPVTDGVAQTVTFDLPRADLARWGDTGWITDPGTYAVAVGRSERDLPLRAMFAVN